MATDASLSGRSVNPLLSLSLLLYYYAATEISGKLAAVALELLTARYMAYSNFIACALARDGWVYIWSSISAIGKRYGRVCWMSRFYVYIRNTGRAGVYCFLRERGILKSRGLFIVSLN